MPAGLVPAVNGDPDTAVSVPSVRLMANPETSPPWLAAYTNLPAESAPTATGPVPALNGDPVTAVKAPVPELMVKAHRRDVRYRCEQPLS